MMIKFIKTFCLVGMLFYPLLSHASLIHTDLTSDSYITFDDKYWAWASPVNAQFYECDAVVENPELYLTEVYEDENNSCINQLLAPSFHEGWRFATNQELNVLKTELTLSSFMRADYSLINASTYWNTQFTHVDYPNFMNGLISSDWQYSDYETFYIKDSTTVPEPSTLLILSLSIIALAIRKKLKH